MVRAVTDLGTPYAAMAVPLNLAVGLLSFSCWKAGSPLVPFRRQKSCFLQGKFAAGLLFGFGDEELSLASGSSEHYRVGFISIVASGCLGAA